MLQKSKYIYEKSKGGVNGMAQMPPPPGTAMNCESAARIFFQLAKDMGIDDLQAVFYSRGEYGYFVPTCGKLALGCQPEINTPVAKGEFDNHWRVRDPQTGLCYDPTFGTSGQNPVGYIGTSMNTDRSFNMTTVYAEKFRIERNGVRVTCTDVSKMPPGAQFAVSDMNYIPKPMTMIR